MYRIELAPGEITVFRTIEELATGVRNGLITPKARIYHSASDKWLPIEFHPHYKQALELTSGNAKDSAGRRRGASSKQGSSKAAGSKPSKEGFTFLNVPISAVTPLPKTKTQLADPSPLDHAQAHAQAAGPVDDHVPIELSRAYDTPAPAAPVDVQPVHDIPVIHHSPTDPSLLDDSRAEVTSPKLATSDSSPSPDAAAHAPIDHSPTHETFDRAPIDQSPDWPSPVHHSPIDPVAALPVEARVVEQPFRDAPRARLAVEELFTPPPPRAAAPSVSEPAVAEPAVAEPAVAEPAVSELAVSEVAVSVSPVLELPQISYPEISPVESPVAEGSSSASRAKRTMPLVAAVVVLAVGGYASTSVFSLGGSDNGFTAASTMADRPVVPAHPSATPPEPATASTPTRPPARPAASPSRPAATGSTVSPASQSPLPPASSGFARALDPRAIVSAPVQRAPKPDAAIDSTAAPVIDMQLSVPDLKGADSLVAPATQQGDSAMKRILKAVGGKKSLP